MKLPALILIVCLPALIGCAGMGGSQQYGQCVIDDVREGIPLSADGQMMAAPNASKADQRAKMAANFWGSKR